MGKFNDHLHNKRKSKIQPKKTEAEQFIRALYEIAKKCDFKDTKTDQIRDAIVIGFSDRDLSEGMQLNDDLIFKMTMARQSEIV